MCQCAMMQTIGLAQLRGAMGGARWARTGREVSSVQKKSENEIADISGTCWS